MDNINLLAEALLDPSLAIGTVAERNARVVGLEWVASRRSVESSQAFERIVMATDAARRNPQDVVSRASKRAERGAADKGPRAAAISPIGTRRRPLVIAIGVALAVVFGLASWSIASNASNTVTVLVTKNDVVRGAEIKPADLSSIEVSSSSNSVAIPAAEVASVSGRIAQVDLPVGSLLTLNNVASNMTAASGKSIVGLGLPTENLPSVPLHAGDRIRIVETPGSKGEPIMAKLETVPAVVVGSQLDPTSGRTIVDAEVDNALAAVVVARSAAGRVGIILDPQGK